jgi:hypothetical protein
MANKAPSIHKSSASIALESPSVFPVSESWKEVKGRLISLLGGPDNTELWLNSPHPSLDGQTPQSYVDEGKIKTLEYFVCALETGQPS